MSPIFYVSGRGFLWLGQGNEGPSPHTPLSRLDLASWAELGQAVLVPMTLRRVGCGDLGVQECMDTHMQCRDTGRCGQRISEMWGVNCEACAHTSPDTSYPIAGVVVTPRLEPTKVPLGLAWAAVGTGVAEGYSWCG